MLGGYFARVFAVVLLICLVFAAFGMLILKVGIVSYFNIIFAIVTLLSCLIARAVVLNSFKKKFARSI